MKKLLFSLAAVALSVASMYAQGRVNFNNFASAGVTVGVPFNQGPSGGTGGAFVGANYSVQLLWAPVGSYADHQTFVLASLGSSASFAFFGATGGSPGVDGAGLFDGLTVPTPVGTGMPAGNYTMMAHAWFNNGTFASYAAAEAAGKNVGYVFFNQAVTASPTPINTTAVPAFTVGIIIPEPSTLALAGLSAAAMLLFRRKK